MSNKRFTTSDILSHFVAFMGKKYNSIKLAFSQESQWQTHSCPIRVFE
jgi:hypothetical protein